MAAKVAILLQKYKKIFPKTCKLQGFAWQSAKITDSWIIDTILVTS